MLLQSRANRVNEILTSEQINEIADAPAGEVDKTLRNIRLSQEDPYYKRPVVKAPMSNTQGRTFSGKPDSERMGVVGSTPSAQTSQKALESAPQIVAAERGPRKD